MDSAESARLIKKHAAPIWRLKEAADALARAYGLGHNPRSPRDVVTDLEDAICFELEALEKRLGDAKRKDYVPPDSPVWPLIDLAESEDALTPNAFRHERDVLAVGIAEAALLGGGWNGENMIGGPALLLLVKDMGEVLKEQSDARDAESKAATDIEVPAMRASECEAQGPSEANRNGSSVHDRVGHMVSLYNGDTDPIRLRNERDAFVWFIADASLTAGLWDGKTKLNAMDVLDLCAKMGKEIRRTTEEASSATPIGSALIEWSSVADEERRAVSTILQNNAESVYFGKTKSALLFADSMLAALACYRNPGDAYQGIERLGSAWSSLPREWAELPLDLKQSMIEGLFAWLNGIDKKDRHPDAVRMCQVAEDLLCAAQHLGAGTTPHQTKPIIIGDALKRLATKIRGIDFGGAGISSTLQSIARELDGLAQEESLIGFDHGDKTADATGYVEREFTCPKCGSHNFWTCATSTTPVERRCQGNGCKFRWPMSDDALHMKSTGVPFAPPIYIDFKTALAIAGADESDGRVADTVNDADNGAPLAFRAKIGDTGVLCAIDNRSIGFALRVVCDMLNAWAEKDEETRNKVAKLKRKVTKWKKRAKQRG